MKKLFIMAAILAATQLAQARQMPTLDIDALLFSSESVVEGPIVVEHTKTYDFDSRKLTLLEGADVRVEKTLVGADLNGKIVQVGDLSLYRKGQMWIRYSKLEKRIVNGKTQMHYAQLPADKQPKSEQLKIGDRAIFFLWKPASTVNLTGQKNRADFWALSSGVRLIRKDQISGFSQMSNPGGYGERRGTSRAAFDAGFAASLKRVRELQSRLAAPPDAKDREFFQNWLLRREESKKRSFWHGSDSIANAVKKRLALLKEKGL